MLAEVPRFHRAARRLLATARTIPTGLTLGRVPRRRPLLRLLHRALRPAAGRRGVVVPARDRADYPARYLFAFLANHGMLSVTGSPPGTRSPAVPAATSSGRRRGCPRSSCPRRCARCAVTRTASSSATTPARRTASTPWSSRPIPTRRCACSTRPPTAERDVLGAIGYTRNPPCCTPTSRCCRATARLRPRGTTARRLPPRADGGPRQLQHEPAAAPARGEDYVVTLNGAGRVDPGRVIDRMDYAHPVYTPASVAAQRRLPELNTASPRSPAPTTAGASTRTAAGPAPQAARALGGTW